MKRCFLFDYIRGHAAERDRGYHILYREKAGPNRG
jgi:hypothetical protein